jgi:hypothetical protein
LLKQLLPFIQAFNVTAYCFWPFMSIKLQLLRLL